MLWADMWDHRILEAEKEKHGDGEIYGKRRGFLPILAPKMAFSLRMRTFLLGLVLNAESAYIGLLHHRLSEKMLQKSHNTR